MFTDPEASIPPKCRVCNIKYVPLSIERQLNSAQLQIFLFYMAIKQVTRKDRIVHCPFCRYFEIWLKECTSNFFYCKDPICMKGSCSVCHKEFKIPKNDKNISIEEAKEMKSKTGMESHFLCYEYKEIKKDWEDAILNGNRTVCPKCKIGGIKDDACTHMTCNNCGTVYCYICGDSEDKVNKSNKSGIKDK